jgi:hypothetical protein
MKKLFTPHAKQCNGNRQPFQNRYNPSVQRTGKTPKHSFGFLILIASIFLTFHSCDKDTPVQEQQPSPIAQDVVSLINSVDLFQEKEAFSERVAVLRDTTWTEQTNIDPRAGTSLRSFATNDDKTTVGRSTSDVECHAFNVTWRHTVKRHSASQNPNDFVMFHPRASVLWPGNLVQGSSLASGIPASVPVSAAKRQPGNISLAIVTSGSETTAPMYRTVDRMSLSGVNEAMNNIYRDFPEKAMPSIALKCTRSGPNPNWTIG